LHQERNYPPNEISDAWAGSGNIASIANVTGYLEATGNFQNKQFCFEVEH
jgi:hypothetical protein